MTTDGPQTSGAIRRLRRRTSDRVIGGVAGGLGDYFNVDPLLVRIGFVGLMLFGGAGLVLYVVAWLLIPHEGSDESTVERVLRRFASWRLFWIGAVIVALLVILWGPVRETGYYWIDSPILWAIAVIVVGVLVLRRESPPPTADASVQAPAVPAVPAPAVVPPPVEVKRPPSPLGWYVLAAMLVVVGVLAMVQNVGQLDVELGQYFGVALLLLGIGLVIGSWWGRARLLILLGLLLLPLGVAASFVTAPIEGGWGDQTFAPTNAAELRSEYRLVGGRMTLDLTQLAAATAPIHVDASVAVGQLIVIVPARAELDVQMAIGGGDMAFLGTWVGATGMTEHFVRHGTGQTLVLSLETGVGDLRVLTPDARTGECIGCDCAWWTSCAVQLVPEEN